MDQDQLRELESDQSVNDTAATYGGAGKSTLTSRLTPAPQMVFRVSDPETARALGESLSMRGQPRILRDADAGASGARDANGVSFGAEAAVDRAASSSGSALPSHLQRQFEDSLGADLSSVRVHTGSDSAVAAHAVGAKAYTVGQDIHFAAGKYQPEDPFGMHLLAHEVAHTVQQSGGSAHRQHKLEVSAPQDAAESEADVAADAMVRGERFSVWGATGLARQVLRNSDDTMMEYSDSYSKGLSSTTSRLQIIGGHSVVADASEAQNIVNKITSQEDNLQKAAKEDDSWTKCQAENVATRMYLQEYIASVKLSGSHLDGFQPAYESLRRDYGSLVGMSAQFAEGHRTDSANPEVGAIDDAATLMDSKKDMSGEVKAMQGGNKAFNDSMAEFKAARDQLETARAAITQQAPKVQANGEAMKSQVAKMQSAAAAAKVDKKKSEMAKLQAKIAAVAKGVATAVEMGGKVLKVVQAPDIKTSTKMFADEYVRVGDQLMPKGLGDSPIHVEMGPSRATRAAELGSQLASGNIEALVTELGNLAMAGEMRELSSAIAAAEEEKNLADAQAAKAELETARANYETAIKAMANLLKAFVGHKARVDKTSADLAKFAGKTGHGDVAAAIRFIAGADKYLAQADLVLTMGKQQQTAGGDAIKARAAIDSPISNSRPSSHGQSYYWEAVRGSDKNWGAQKNTIELKNAGEGGLLSGGSSNGTQYDVSGAMSELAKQKVAIANLREKAQSKVGLSGPAANVALTPAAG